MSWRYLSGPPITTRNTARPTRLPPIRALSASASPNAISTAMKVTGSRNVAGGNQIAGRGHSDPTVNDAADAAARWGLAKSSGSSRNSASTWAASASWGRQLGGDLRGGLR
jgi:hypothetical protein